MYIEINCCGDCRLCDEQIDVNWCDHEDGNFQLPEDVWNAPIPERCPLRKEE